MHRQYPDAGLRILLMLGATLHDLHTTRKMSEIVLVQVYKESSKRAIDEQFGGEDETPPPAPGFTAPTLKLTKYSNAYMLVYIRESSWKDIMLEVSQDDIAEHVRSRLEVSPS